MVKIEVTRPKPLPPPTPTSVTLTLDYELAQNLHALLYSGITGQVLVKLRLDEIRTALLNENIPANVRFGSAYFKAYATARG